MSYLSSLVDLERAKLPEGIGEGVGVVGDVVGAVAGAAAGGVHVAGVLAAQVDVDDDALVAEVRADVAVGVGEVGGGLAPGAGVGGLRGHVGGDFVAPEGPQADALGAPLHGHDAALRRVVRGAVTSGLVAYTTARVVVGGVVAVARERGAGHLALHVHGAAVGGVQRHLVALGGLVDGLHDVDLAVIGPVVRVDEPQRRPRAAPERRVLDVEDEEPAVVLRLGLHPHRESACGCVRVRARPHARVDLEHRRVRGCVG